MLRHPDMQPAEHMLLGECMPDWERVLPGLCVRWRHLLLAAWHKLQER
jgi:hypothetical protein